MNEWLCESKKRMNIWEKLMFIQKNFSLNPQHCMSLLYC